MHSHICRAMQGITFSSKLGSAMWKRVFGHTLIAKTQISLRIRAVWSGPSLFAYRIIGYWRIYRYITKVLIRLYCFVGWPGSLLLPYVQNTYFLWHGPSYIRKMRKLGYKAIYIKRPQPQWITAFSKHRKKKGWWEIQSDKQKNTVKPV